MLSRLIGLLLLGLLASGCSVVLSKHPLSKVTKPIDREKFEGIWHTGGEDGVIHVAYAKSGVLEIATMERKEEVFETYHAEAIVTGGKAHNFLSLREKEDDGSWSDYFFIAYRFTDDGDFIYWMPDTKYFTKLVNDKKLSGSVSKDDKTVMINNPPGKLLELVNDSDNLKLFDYRNPHVLKKLK